MGPVHHRALDRSRRVSFLKKDRRGVASTVGTIMALMVFIALLALITNSYVPAWMLDNERSHMNQVADQFGQLKSDVDSMVLQQRVNGDNSIKMYAPIKLGSEGVPLFATPTVGLLSYVPQGTSTSGIHVQFTDSSGAVIDQNGGGRVDLYVPNRYYVPQWVCYENGAIIIKQDDGQSVRAMPNLDVQKAGGKINVAFTQINLLGANQSLTGSDSVGFSLDLIYVDAQTYTVGGNGTWHLSMTTEYGDAWFRYLDDMLTGAGLVGSDSGSAHPDFALEQTKVTDDVSTIDLIISNVGTLQYNTAQVEMTLLTS